MFQVNTTLVHKRPGHPDVFVGNQIMLPPTEEARISIHLLDDTLRISLWDGEETHVFLGHFSQVGGSVTHVIASINDPDSVVRHGPLRESSEMAFLEYVEEWLRTQVVIEEGFLVKGVKQS